MKIYGSIEAGEALKNGEITVAVYGLGKMGLPLASIFAEKGANVIGVDVSEEVVKGINSGECHVKEEPGLADLVKSNVGRGRLRATTNGVGAAKEADMMIILVPAFLNKSKKADLGIVSVVAETISKGLEAGDFVVVETTLPPGATEKKIRLILERSGLKAGEDFGLAHCPERTSSGRAVMDILGAYPKVVGGVAQKSTETAEHIYRVLK